MGIARKSSRLGTIMLSVLALAGCAEESGPHPGSEPPVPSGMARLYVYRDFDPNGPLIWTQVSLDHRPIGASAPGTVFYRDLPPGIYEIEVRSDQRYPDQFKTVRLVAGSNTFAKIGDLMFSGAPSYSQQASTFDVMIVNPVIAAREIALLRLSPG